MARLTKAFFAAAAMLLLFAALTAVTNLPDKGSGPEYAVVVVYPGNGQPLIIKAELVSTDEQRATGLMFREALGENEGMLFIFPQPAPRNFWMKNTLLPLDMVFIAENMTIVKIHHAVPCTNEPCPLYSSQQPVKYVLEVNGNLTTGYGIEEGSRVKIRH